MDNETLWLFVRMIILLPLVLGLAYLTIKYGLARSKGFSSGASRYMRVVEHMPLGPKGGLVLVEIGGQYYLVAFQENNVTLLKEFASLPEPITGSGLGPGSMTDFKDVLSQQMKQLIGRKGRSGSGCPENNQQKK
ncbi:flagellar biosynthetic protein FliO [Desulforamulus aeronauticus]|uniref:Flagellar protein n=1 Tax=Desulforamulus aeronauticus DSM 10349 TaxID=1121421 RepID=A0A1M6RC96_9FIRM|nr:flagellar biosynthetic protein FliO [Desulforamulus aeronauticus]SHK30081.1 flagellar protein FliO/FliZ [Desulforamulus aeronauticus DSM 10349]